MREKLAVKNNERLKFTGTFERYGSKKGWGGKMLKTILLKDLLDSDGGPACDHLWFSLTKAFAALGLQPGDRVEFFARVKRYTKGYYGYREDVYKPIETDYKLSHPTKVKKIKGDNSLNNQYVNVSIINETTNQNNFIN